MASLHGHVSVANIYHLQLTISLDLLGTEIHFLLSYMAIIAPQFEVNSSMI